MKGLITTLLLLVSINYTLCQNTFIDINLDPRAIAMGESFVANPNGLIALNNNPATLIGIKNTSAFYSRRNMNWMKFLDDVLYYSFGASTPTPIGNFGITYKRLNFGESPVSTVESPEGSGLVEIYHYMYVLSYSKKITGGLSAGINLKASGVSYNVKSGNFNPPEEKEPFLADLGILYSTNGFFNNNYSNDNLNVGLALYNYGTDYVLKVNNSNGSSDDVVVKIPRYLKIGFAYSVNTRNNTDINQFSFIFTGEYDRMLNNYASESQRDTWSTGIEASFYEFVFVRLGGIANPYNSIYGEKGVFSARYGVGLNFPFRLLKISSPISVTFDYAVIPLNSINIFSSDKRNLDAFNLQVSYNKSLF